MNWEELSALRWAGADKDPGTICDVSSPAKWNMCMAFASANPDAYALAERQAIQAEYGHTLTTTPLTTQPHSQRNRTHNATAKA